MKRILMLLLTAGLIIGAAIPDAEARGYHRSRRSHRNTRSTSRRGNRHRRVFSRHGSFTHGLFSKIPGGEMKLDAEQERVAAKDDRRMTDAFLEGMRYFQNKFKRRKK